jgi:hypothetical protein
MPSSVATWDVVATVDGAGETLQAFVHHHLGAGCRRVHLYFDDPADPLLRLWQGRPGVSAQRGRLPAVQRNGQMVPFHVRQCANATDALTKSESDWLAHLAIDEWLLGAGRVSQALAALPADVIHVRVPTHEATFDSWQAAQKSFNCTHFRRAADGEGWKAAYGEQARRLLGRGLAGHAVGKCLLRRGRIEAQGGVHFWRDKASGEWLPATLVKDDELSLLHFDAVSYPLWKARLEQEALLGDLPALRQRQLDEFLKAKGDDAQLKQFFCSLYVVDAAGRDLLTAANGLKALDIATLLPRVPL